MAIPKLLNVRIPAEVHTALHHLAKSRQSTVTALVLAELQTLIREAVKEYRRYRRR